MKHLSFFFALAVLISICTLFTSCGDGEWLSAYNDDKYVGEWRVVRYATTYNDKVITDESELSNIWMYGWLILSKSSSKSATTIIAGNYTVKDDKITFYYYAIGGKYSDSYDVFSFDNEELILTDSESHTDFFTLRKFHEGSINTQDIVGKWRAYRMITYHNNGDKSLGYTERLNGLEYINISNTDITLMGKNRICSYYIANNNLYTTPNLSEFAISSAHIMDVNNNRLYVRYVSLDKKSEMYVTYGLIEED
jgi:hypothetical protein